MVLGVITVTQIGKAAIAMGRGLRDGQGKPGAGRTDLGGEEEALA